MINKQKVYDYISTISGLTLEQIKKYDLIIDVQISAVNYSLADLQSVDDERILALIASRANYEIALSRSAEDGVTSFSAGDIHISQNNNYLDNARMIMQSAYDNCRDLIKDNSFAFLGV